MIHAKNDGCDHRTLRQDFTALSHDEQAEFLKWATACHNTADLNDPAIQFRDEITHVWVKSGTKAATECPARRTPKGKISVSVNDGFCSSRWYLDEYKLRCGEVITRYNDLLALEPRDGWMIDTTPPPEPDWWEEMEAERKQRNKEHDEWMERSRKTHEEFMESIDCNPFEDLLNRVRNAVPKKSSAELTKEMMANHPDRGGDPELFKELNNEREKAKRYESRVAEVAQ